ncbi:MAG: hypothetical protein CFE43_01190 [Burkholderiales bacterium PBB3]|nr:MAG: hypothetical protein CFE43_01190 [Burkholderiales bacterium PBB3]
MKLIAAPALSTASTDQSAPNLLVLDNTQDPRTLDLSGVTRIDLSFPKFTDGRAYSQAFLLRRRLGFTGEIRATGDVLIDQLVQMERTGFDVAVLREDQNVEFAQRQFDRYRGFYQGDAVTVKPVFAREGGSALAQEGATA